MRKIEFKTRIMSQPDGSGEFYLICEDSIKGYRERFKRVA